MKKLRQVVRLIFIATLGLLSNNNPTNQLPQIFPPMSPFLLSGQQIGNQNTNNKQPSPTWQDINETDQYLTARDSLIKEGTPESELKVFDDSLANHIKRIESMQPTAPLIRENRGFQEELKDNTTYLKQVVTSNQSKQNIMNQIQNPIKNIAALKDLIQENEQTISLLTPEVTSDPSLQRAREIVTETVHVPEFKKLLTKNKLKLPTYKNPASEILEATKKIPDLNSTLNSTMNKEANERTKRYYEIYKDYLKNYKAPSYSWSDIGKAALIAGGIAGAGYVAWKYLPTDWFGSNNNQPSDRISGKLNNITISIQTNGITYILQPNNRISVKFNGRLEASMNNLTWPNFSNAADPEVNKHFHRLITFMINRKIEDPEYSDGKAILEFIKNEYGLTTITIESIRGGKTISKSVNLAEDTNLEKIYQTYISDTFFYPTYPNPRKIPYSSDTIPLHYSVKIKGTGINGKETILKGYDLNEIKNQFINWDMRNKKDDITISGEITLRPSTFKQKSTWQLAPYTINISNSKKENIVKAINRLQNSDAAISDENWDLKVLQKNDEWIENNITPYIKRLEHWINLFTDIPSKIEFLFKKHSLRSKADTDRDLKEIFTAINTYKQAVANDLHTGNRINNFIAGFRHIEQLLRERLYAIDGVRSKSIWSDELYIQYYFAYLRDHAQAIVGDIGNLSRTLHDILPYHHLRPLVTDIVTMVGQNSINFNAIKAVLNKLKEEILNQNQTKTMLNECGLTYLPELHTNMVLPESFKENIYKISNPELPQIDKTKALRALLFDVYLYPLLATKQDMGIFELQ